MSNVEQDRLADICSIEDFSKKYPYLHFTRERFQYLLRYKKTNGLGECGALVKDGRCYKIKCKIFSAWYYRHINIFGRE